MPEKKEEEVVEEKTYYDEDGEEVKFPGDPETIKKQLEESKSAAEKLKELEESQAKLSKELEGYKNKDYNFKALREKAEKKEEELTTTEKLMLEQEEKIQSINKTMYSNWSNKALSEVAGSDEELRKKVQNAYDSLNIDATTEEEIQDKYSKAYLLATGTSANKSTINSVARDFGGNPPIPSTKPEKLSEEQKELGKNLGLTEEDYKKYNV